MSQDRPKALPSETGNPDLGLWDRNDSSDLFGHLSPFEFNNRFCPDCGGLVDAEVNAEIAKNGSHGRWRKLFRCPDCGRSFRRADCDWGSFLSPGMIDPEEIIGNYPLTSSNPTATMKV